QGRLKHPGHPAPSRPPGLRYWLVHAKRREDKQMAALTALAAVSGLVVGLVCAAVALRRGRRDAHEQLAALTNEVLARTGDSLAQRAGGARRADRHRPPG